MSVNTCTGIPAGAHVFCIQAHSYDILAAIHDCRCQIYPERGISIWMAANFLAVQPYLCMSHGTVKVQIKAFAFILLFHLEMFSVPSDAAPGKLTGESFQIRAERAFYGPVMR